jgi:hypothetical protein
MNTHELKGIDGTNPIGFLAAMGAFRVATLRAPNATLAWQSDAPAPYPLLATTLSPEGFAQAVCEEAARVAEALKKHGDVIKCAPAQYRETCKVHLDHGGLPGDLSLADYFSAFACDSVTDKDGFVLPTLLSFSNGGGGQKLLKDFAALSILCDLRDVQDNIFGKQIHTKACTNLNWAPNALRSYALRWKDPEKTDKESNVPLHVLAFLGLALFPCAPNGAALGTTGFDGRGKAWKWPIWTTSAAYHTVTSLLASPCVCASGIRYYSSLRFSSNKRLYFTPSTPI